MNFENDESENAEHEKHDRQARAVTDALVKLNTNLAPVQFSPEAIFEGAIKGGAVVLISRLGCSGEDIADLLTEMAEAFRDLDNERIHAVS